VQIPLEILGSILGGILGGILVYLARSLHMELEWHQVKTALRRQYQRERKERPLDIAPMPVAPRTDAEIRDYVMRRNPHLYPNGRT